MNVGRGLGVTLVGAGLVVLSCSADRGRATVDVDASASAASAGPFVDSREAETRIAELRARFPRAPLGTAAATRFEAGAGGDAATHVRAVLPSDALRGVTRAAHVALPVLANGEVQLEDDRSHTAVRFSLQHVQDARIEVGSGMALYRGALDGADVVHRVHAEGTEDFVVFETRPAREELSYAVDVSRVAGLRLVSNTLEFMDDGGTPALRVAPPYLVDAKGERHEATLAVDGCAYDTNPAGPWGRAVTRPGAVHCGVRVTWVGVTYPVMVDPAWGTTGSLVVARFSHVASVLPSGKVLVAGGYNALYGYYISNAELYDPGGNAGAGTFAATGSMTTPRYMHSATVLASGKVLIVGGVAFPSGVVTYLSSAELYDAVAGTFGATGSMSVPREVHTASLLASGKVLITSGCSVTNCPGLATAEIFDPSGNAGVGSFSPTGPMVVARTQATASVLASGKVLIAGGCSAGEMTLCNPSLKSAEVFDPAGNGGVGTFVATGGMAAYHRMASSVALPSGKVLIAAGIGAGTVAELFDPTANAGAGAFANTGAVVDSGRNRYSATLLPSGKVLFAGGAGSTTLATAELFDPAGNAGVGTFAAIAPMATARYSHTASLLPSGKVLVAGGESASPIASAELLLGGLGDPCSANDACLSKLCVDGVCCDSACSAGGCDRCDVKGKEGTCSIAPSGDPGTVTPCAFPLACDGVSATCPSACSSDSMCAPAYFCGPNNSCVPRKAKGAPCNPAASCKQPGCRECVTDFCADGVCCDAACTGQCEACDSVPGTCSPVNGKPHGARSACPPGNVCKATTNKCEVNVATCDGDHTTTGSDGTSQDCAPYKCTSDGTCRVGCGSVSDCAAPAICDSNGKCVAPSASAAADGGCAISRVRASDDATGLAACALGFVLLTLRARSRRSEKGSRR